MSSTAGQTALCLIILIRLCAEASIATVGQPWGTVRRSVDARAPCILRRGGSLLTNPLFLLMFSKGRLSSPAGQSPSSIAAAQSNKTRFLTRHSFSICVEDCAVSTLVDTKTFDYLSIRTWLHYALQLGARLLRRILNDIKMLGVGLCQYEECVCA